jgi:hypothetical protein
MANRILEWWDVRGTVKALVINRQERERRQRESTFNPHTPHEQHFTRGRLNRLLESAGFRVERVGHSDFMSWVPYLRNIRAVAQFDCAVADHLPSILVSGWAIHARRP